MLADYSDSKRTRPWIRPPRPLRESQWTLLPRLPAAAKYRISLSALDCPETSTSKIKEGLPDLDFRIHYERPRPTIGSSMGVPLSTKARVGTAAVTSASAVSAKQACLRVSDSRSASEPACPTGRTDILPVEEIRLPITGPCATTLFDYIRRAEQPAAGEADA
jgi:hypothetical protein